MCAYDNWECKCHSQKKIMTCYDNCPDAENRTLQEMQVQIYCAALSGKGYNSELIDRMTRPAKVVADDQPPPTHAAAPQAPPPAAPPKANDADDAWAGGRGGGRGLGNGNVSIVRDDAARSQMCVKWATLLVIVALGLLMAVI
ncbi:hypothetical protein GGI04_002518 [Coemansia thaxteri]|uniref:Uncharacterized protein n=1 Tax=Coemansia thaxteri TaxID=2663907 RepID=A0A9W8EHC8_9FUNG|nr:hypothetical protein GGI04_002518 [Coemansia thaxteri]KAJ2007108.1 hypothetical protein H4R26_001001 [Coemansia thaxteri]KAJ2471648.1 hypothetical protein GGI02_002136 [Coemansia sp. RSA 2322]KAJ2487838.1 hypothetical protein EV174_000269 [Coemansia sp. RSA 2320]